MIWVRRLSVAGTILAFLALPRGLMGAPAATGNAVHQPPGIASLVRLESSPAVVDVAYRYGQVTAAADGAYGPNVSAPRSAWYLEYQRAGATDVIAGVLREDPALIAEGLRIFHFGLARETRIGGFPGSAWPFHGTAFFLSEAAPALLVLRASSFAPQFAAELSWQTLRMQRAAHYMVRWVGGPGKIDDHTKDHRWYEAAIALGAAGVLAGDEQLVQWSHLYAQSGMRQQWANGVMPEDGGHDSGYQALGLSSAVRYLVLVAGGRLRTTLYRALQLGEQWELSRIESDGSVNQAGDTRTAGCRERDPAGQCKTVFYAPIYTALARWAVVSGDPRFQAAATLVWQRSGYGNG